MLGERETRVRELRRAGARGREIEELLAYTANPFDLSRLNGSLRLPLEDEEFVPIWRQWQKQARQEQARQEQVGQEQAGQEQAGQEQAGVKDEPERNRLSPAGRDSVFRVLSRYLTELAFPIVEGVSHWPSYRQATLHGVPPSELPGATGLLVNEPGSIELEVMPSLAGAVPVITVRDRASFVAMVRALSRRNEPEPIPDALGGLMITGYTNWQRLREKFGANAARYAVDDASDRLMLLSDGPYSAVPAAALGLAAADWRRLSLQLRSCHEQIHYLMRRLLGAMRNNLFDELIAEYLGMHQAWGFFKPAWLRLFLGLEEASSIRPGGRLDVYRGDPPLSLGAFEALGVLVRRAIETLEAFDEVVGDGYFDRARLAAVLGALASQRLELLASPQGIEALVCSFKDLERLLSQAPGTAARSAR